jgi:hypothetical protein
MFDTLKRPDQGRIEDGPLLDLLGMSSPLLPAIPSHVLPPEGIASQSNIPIQAFDLLLIV